MLDAPEPPLDADVVALGRVSARGDRCSAYSLGERRRLERRRHGGAQQLLVPETADACEGLQASSAPGFIRPPWKPTANPSNARIAVEPFAERNSSPCRYPRRYRVTGTVEWR